ncbi:hypothetical protein P3X46_028527 [Hevea brasiliensis]|uniref:Protein kinase domain-containing protein n=2 Tax=Hevea brasiliensis TaxID=3981 RepID=A0ABQ9KSP6_HEVBR|nr:hypothetical protein P3X46_028527 [Hevea brasiliensis]
MGFNTMLMKLALPVVIVAAVSPLATAQAKPGCKSHCGNISIPYPFGTTQGCYMDEQFLITCNNATNPPKPFLNLSNIPVLDISLDGYLRILDSVSYNCYEDSPSSRPLFESPYFRRQLEFPISNTKNIFTLVGCNTDAEIIGLPNKDRLTGCVSVCLNNSTNLMKNGECSHTGCCQSPLPRGMRDYYISIALFKDSKIPKLYPCNYAFIAEDGVYNFSSSDLDKNLRNITDLPMVLDWSIGNQTCEQAKKDPKTFACKEFSYCIDSKNGSGYRCNCSAGFQGNPYIPNGCQDIDECETLKPCNGTCHNVPGSYDCSCPAGFEGDGRKDGAGCILQQVMATHQSKRLPHIITALGISISLLALLLGISWIYLGRKQRKFRQLKEKYFLQNGGNLLERELSKHNASIETAKIFTAEDLKKATNNYDESRILGEGGQGRVYKGILPDNQVIAIKKAKTVDQSQVEKFINEVIILSQINHKNVVKLLGCCLETEAPLLVYEFVTNGTLFDHLHRAGRATLIPWETRLKIATETAGALSYLHSAASTPIIHRDIKLANILLDDNYTAKVSDFGASRLIPSDQTQFTTLLQGTLGYLDPEYLHTHQLTVKSDVYSFGVVLIELVTGKKAVSFDRPEEERNLALYFVSLVDRNSLVAIFDQRVLSETNIEEMMAVAMLGMRCVRVKGDERPTMKEVAMELEALRAMRLQPCGEGDSPAEDQDEYILTKLCKFYYEGMAVNNTVESQVTFEIEGGR